MDLHYVEQYIKSRMIRGVNINSCGNRNLSMKQGMSDSDDTVFVFMVDAMDYRKMKQMIGEFQGRIIKKPINIDKVKYINSLYFK